MQHDCDASAGLENCHASGLKYLLNAAYGNDDTLSVSGPAECAKRFEFAVPRRGAGVLNSGRTPYRSPGELASPYLSAGSAQTVDPNPRNGYSRLFSDFFGVFRCSKKR